MFKTLASPKSDSLVIVARQYRGDSRANKLDFGIGVYRDDQGLTPVLAAVKQAELLLQASQPTKAYVAPDGDQEFVRLLTDIILGPHLANIVADRVVGAQSVGGTGAFRLACELIAACGKDRAVWVGLPTWPNHVPLLTAAGLNVRTYPYFNLHDQTVMRAEMATALEGAEAGDIILLHGCCHNPTGADLADADWATIGEICQRRGLIPLIDLAYQGLGQGNDADAAGVRQLFTMLPEIMVATSCSKSFGLYRERTGALLVLTANTSAADTVRGTVQSLARVLYSMPPDHGASVVRIILSDAKLRASWETELSVMRGRIAQMRRLLASAGEQAGLRLSALADQAGLFTTLPITPADIALLRDKHAIFMPDNGRLNMAGLTDDSIAQLVAALDEVLPECFRF
jgi:aromatic-amino-acid transaminase